MTDQEALRLFCGEEHAARRAFDHLHKFSLPFGQSVLRRKFTGCNAADVENAAQQAFLNIWQSRLQMQIPDLPAWRGLLSKTICRCYIDIVRARKPTLTLDELDQVPPDERSDVLDIVDKLAQAAVIGRLIHAADTCWLGLSVQMPAEEHNRRLLAAKLFYLEQADFEEILDLLNRPRPGMRPLSQATVSDWLEDPVVLLHVAYSALYYSPMALTAHLLGMPEETPAGALDALLQSSATVPPPEQDDAPLRRGWAPHESRAILWRYLRNVSAQRIASIPQSNLTLEDCDNIFVRCRALFPFSQRMEDLLTRTDGELKAHCGPGRPGLWRRLAFQYCYLDDLTHLDTQERIEPAARQVAVPINPIVLQGWISSRRLLKALAQTCADLFEEYQNE